MRKSILVGAILAISAMAGVFLLNRPQPKPVQIISAPAEAEPAPAKTIEFSAPIAIADPGFQDLTGTAQHFADFKGKFLIVNLWATWCVPCRAEMPSLDRLQAQAGGPDFEVVAINVDTARRERAPAFLNEIGVHGLKRYADPSADSFETLRLAGKALGLPTSLLIDKQGCELETVAGPANWDSRDALEVVKALAGG